MFPVPRDAVTTQCLIKPQDPWQESSFGFLGLMNSCTSLQFAGNGAQPGTETAGLDVQRYRSPSSTELGKPKLSFCISCLSSLSLRKKKKKKSAIGLPFCFWFPVIKYFILGMLPSFAGSQSSWRPCSQHPLKQVPSIYYRSSSAEGSRLPHPSMSAHIQEQAASVQAPTSAIVLIVFVVIYIPNVL